jgi:hypothetical protein
LQLSTPNKKSIASYKAIKMLKKLTIYVFASLVLACFDALRIEAQTTLTTAMQQLDDLRIFRKMRLIEYDEYDKSEFERMNTIKRKKDELLYEYDEELMDMCQEQAFNLARMGKLTKPRFNTTRIYYGHAWRYFGLMKSTASILRFDFFV